VQALGKLDCSLAELGADCIALSAHKVHGPKGVGALVMARELALEPLLHGGGQERGVRSGTENVAAIVGFGVAAELAEARRAATHAHLTSLRARFVELLAVQPQVRALAPGAVLLPSIVAVLLPVPAEVAMHHIAARGVIVSAGSACQAAKRELSPALRALGMSDDENRRVLRFSFAATTTESEVDRAAQALTDVLRELAAVAR
jgi:cysteine desulfurase